MNNVSMLTTIDNPFSPFTQYEEWLAYDQGKGYHTNEYLARIAGTGYSLSEDDDDALQEQAIDEIVRLNILGIYKKVTENDYPNTTNEVTE